MTNKHSRFFWAYVLVIVLFAVGLSLWIGMNQSIWFDEAYSIMVAKQPVAQAIHLAAVDTHPPLYYLLLHVWGSIVNWDVLGLRALSVGMYGASLLVAALLARRLFGTRAGICTVALIGVAPLLLRYGFEIRMYSLASLIGIGATYVMVRARTAEGRHSTVLWGVYALLVVLGMYTLYYLALLWVAHLLWLLYTTYREDNLAKIHKQAWPWAYVASVVPFLPWLPTFLKQMNNGALAPIGQQMNLENIVGIATFNVLYQPLWQMDVKATIVLLAAAMAWVYIARRGLTAAKKTERPYVLLLAMYVAVPVALLILLSFSRSMYVERYLSHIAIGLIILGGVLISLSLRKPSRVLFAAIGVAGVSMLIGVNGLIHTGNYNFQRMAKPEVAAVAKRVGDCSASNVVAADPYVYIELAAYLPPTCSMQFYSEWDSLGGGYAPLSGSSQQLKSTRLPTGSATTYYVYYDEPKLSTDNLTVTAKERYGNLSIETLRSR